MDNSTPDLRVRFDYEWGTLSAGDLPEEPIQPFRQWLADAGREMGADFNAVVLATADSAGRPSARNVLLREVDEAGDFWFFTNRTSHKGRDMASNPEVSLLFSWLPMHRQVRVDGTSSPLDDEASDRYFSERPRDSQIAAWASSQSEVIESRRTLEDSVKYFDVLYEGREVPRPPHWGGYLVSPRCVEFWQGRPSRLHDRIRYCRAGSGADWAKERLAP